jgi:hypothetical protein
MGFARLHAATQSAKTNDCDVEGTEGCLKADGALAGEHIQQAQAMREVSLRILRDGSGEVCLSRPVDWKWGDPFEKPLHLPLVATALDQFQDHEAREPRDVRQSSQPGDGGRVAPEEIHADIRVQESHGSIGRFSRRVRSLPPGDLDGVLPVGAGLGTLAQAPSERDAVADVGPVGPHADETVRLEQLD